MIVTLNLIDRIKTVKGGYTRIQLELLGAGWPVVKGWKYQVLGNQVKDWRILFYEKDKKYPIWFPAPKKPKKRKRADIEAICQKLF